MHFASHLQVLKWLSHISTVHCINCYLYIYFLILPFLVFRLQMFAQPVLSNEQFSHSRSWQRHWTIWYVFVIYDLVDLLHFQFCVSGSCVFQVDQTPLPLLFMRTVIQAIDAFPTLVKFFPSICYISISIYYAEFMLENDFRTGFFLVKSVILRFRVIYLGFVETMGFVKFSFWFIAWWWSGYFLGKFFRRFFASFC